MADNITLTSAEKPELFQGLNKIAKRYSWTTRQAAAMLLGLAIDVENEEQGAVIARSIPVTEGDLDTDGKGG